MQASNTGLTGGSTPDGATYDRDIVIISTLRMTKISLIDEGRQVICFAGATLFDLENILRRLGREPHSVIGSSCIGAAVVGGISNNSGGALIHRGPAYTQLALYARIDEAGKVELVNHLGVRTWRRSRDDCRAARPRRLHGLRRRARFKPRRIGSRLYAPGARHRRRYAGAVQRGSGAAVRSFRQCRQGDDLRGPARHVSRRQGDGDLLRRHERYGRAHDHPAPHPRRILRRAGTGEYLHRVAYDIAEKYGKDTFLAIYYLGTRWMPTLFAMKGRFDAIAAHTPPAARHQRQARAVWKRALSAPSPETHDGIPEQIRTSSDPEDGGAGDRGGANPASVAFSLRLGRFFRMHARRSRAGRAAPLRRRGRGGALSGHPPRRSRRHRRARRRPEAQ